MAARNRPVVERMPFVDCSGRNMHFGPPLLPWNWPAAFGQSPWLRWVLRNIPQPQQIRTTVLRFAAGEDNLRIHSVVGIPVGSDILRRVAAGIHHPVAVGEGSWAEPEWQ